MPPATTTKKTGPAQPKPTVPRPDGLTIAWMLTLVTTLVCLFAAVLARAYVRFVQPESPTMSLFSGLALFAAAVIGLVLLVMTPIVVYRKRSHPPRGIVIAAYVIGILPWLGMIWQAVNWQGGE
jgi:hypothetical protein